MKVEAGNDETIIPTGCAHDCGGRCVLKLHIKNGKIIKIESDTGIEPQLRACVRGRAFRHRVYATDRLKFPMRRVGSRGEGKFERISWNEALDIITSELKQIKENYGPASIFYIGFSGNYTCILHTPAVVTRLLNMFGGFTRAWGGASCEGGVFACRATYGTLTTGHTRDDLLNSKLIIMWGWNPAETVWVPNTCFYLAQAKEAGARIVCVDPRYTNSAATFSNQWIPIRPVSDTAMLLAMAYVIIREKLQDQMFLDKYTVGFDKFKKYVFGVEDGIPKTPAWAESITGVSVNMIESLARDYAKTKPAALITGYAPGRTAFGEQFHRIAQVLASITGNIGINGGSTAGIGRAPIGVQVGPLMPSGTNPIETKYPYIKERLLRPIPREGTVSISKVWDAILKGKEGGYPSDIKLLYVTHGNPLNQFPNVNKGIKALKKLDFIVVHEQFMTTTAKFADILLPINSHFARNDIGRPWTSGPYYIYNNKVIDSQYESKSDFEICCELAARLGIKDYCIKTEEEWLKAIFDMSRDMSRDISDYEKFRKKGVYKIKLSEPSIAFKKQIDDPNNHPFPTPSGKIEIYSKQLLKLNNPKIPPIPKYIEPWEGLNDPLAKKYPLQLITTHLRRRTHSIFDNIPVLRSLTLQTVWINSKDALERDIQDSALVKVFNNRGEMTIPAKVTERIRPGVVCIPQGAWYKPNKKGVDEGGCANVLTKDVHSPGGAFCSNSTLVEVVKV